MPLTRNDRQNRQKDGCYSTKCPAPVNMAAPGDDPLWVCTHECPEDNHGSRHWQPSDSEAVEVDV